ncbi:helix-turn-helix transcriptional regulator [uncultured Aquimarina sp.]|uniref:helix-turn-helix domain-containing protein n=1 Tax=uncultured Aquimarina sp. TaxID=575652 RepID=UPI0026330D96|nr:helix-turn-helix transcriptional regulator [uncultured Aquimarina sp.]
MSHLLKYREQLNLTQEQLATKANISVRTIQRIEAGKELKGHTLEALSKALEIPKEKLVAVDFEKKEDSISLVKLINISSLFLIILPFGSIIFPIIIMYWKKAFNPITKQIITIQILWTFLFPLVVLLGVFIGKTVNLNNHMVPILILLMLFINAYIIIRNTIELDKKKKLFINLKFNIL